MEMEMRRDRAETSIFAFVYWSVQLTRCTVLVSLRVRVSHSRAAIGKTSIDEGRGEKTNGLVRSVLSRLILVLRSLLLDDQRERRIHFE